MSSFTLGGDGYAYIFYQGTAYRAVPAQAWKLLSAMQGSIGLELARQHRPDLLLLDLHLPDMSGADVLRSLLDDPRTRNIPAVVVSADATPGQIPKLLAAGAKAYLTKPLDLRRLLAVIDETLAGERLTDAG